MNIKNKKFGLAEFAAIGTWAVVFGISLYSMIRTTEDIPKDLGYVVLFFITYLLTFLSVTMGFVSRSKPNLISMLILLQLLSAFALVWFIQLLFLSILTVIWVAVLPHFMSIKKSILVMLLMLITWFSFYAYHWQQSIIFTALLFSSFHFFSILMAYQTIEAEKSALEAERLHKELKSAQYLLEQATRQNERTRIARDLHDLVGHHLTALIINLQVAGHISSGEAKDKVEQCHSLAKLLLSDVREAVTSMRESQSLDFREMVDLMIENIPHLIIHNQIDTDLNLENIKLARSLLSCVQEATTNCLRHSGASELWISMAQKNNILSLSLIDNGHLDDKLVKGNGLIGMQERVEQLEGKMMINTESKSMNIHITIPLTQSQSGLS